MSKKDVKRIHLALRRIGLALAMSHNLIVTDVPGDEPDETHWRTNHSKELKDLKYIQDILINIGIYRECTCCNISPSKESLETH